MSFAAWLERKWIDHVDELLNWENCSPTYNSSQYFHKYKWLLKREYRHYLKSEQ